MGQNNTYPKKNENILYSQEFRLKFSESVGVDWKALGRWLNIEEHYIDVIDHDNTRTDKKAYLMITKWVQMNDKPTLMKLRTTLKRMKRMDLNRKIDEFTKTSCSQESSNRVSAKKETPGSPEITSRFCETFKLIYLEAPGSPEITSRFPANKETPGLPEVTSRFSANNETPCSTEITSRFSANKDTSEMCTALKNYYREKYGKINKVQPPLKVPANVDLMDNFVDLCIVDAVNTQMDIVFNFERKIFLEKQMNYTPIPYNEIFMKEKSVILISGVAGIGKTWLLRKCLLDWSNNLIWKNVKLVFYLECRRLNQYPNISNLNELLNVFYKDIINDFKVSNHPALFIIDGLDEFKFLNELINCSSSCKYPIVNALIEIQNYKYVVAGRVYAIDQYQSISIEHSDKLNIQIMGFNQIGIHKYIENKVREEKKDVVKETLNSSPIAKAMASVPFYLCSMCKIISNSKEINKNSFLTMTNLNASIFLYFFQNHIIKTKKLMNKIIEDDSNKKYILNICKIAYELFVENKVIFSEEEIQTFIIDFDNNESNLFGFIEKIETDEGCYYQFAHLTIMEFCASVYAYNCLSIEEIIANKKLESCLSMICGLSNKSQNSLLKLLVNFNPSKNGSEELLYSILGKFYYAIRYEKFTNFYLISLKKNIFC
ncbi:NACHT, LRR and PYD domains-containing protein 3-like isoform X4 [Hydra vulgaris]|uniref:NACHT, LRR and PYD domains-containing protein 3-like isoform X4 n=1 Tax=Hydra vulgaris TaxID=6087 RepID=A0ABM4BBA7_HYDVU